MIFVTLLIFVAVAFSIGLKNLPDYEMFDKTNFKNELKSADLNEISNYATHNAILWKRDSDDENDIDDDWEFWPPRIFPTILKSFQEQKPATESFEPELSLRRTAAAANIYVHGQPKSGFTDEETDSETSPEDDNNTNTVDPKIDDNFGSEPKKIHQDASPESIPALENEVRLAPTDETMESKTHDIRSDNSEFERALFKMDRSKITMFNKRIAVLFPKLLRLAHDAAEFAAEKQRLESELQSLSLLHSWLIKDGNFLVHEISRPFEVTKSLFHSLVHRQSSMDKINAMVKGIPEYKPVGEFHLKLVEFEIGLFEFLRPDTKFKNPATREFQDIFSKVRTSLIELRKKFLEVVPEKSLFHATFEKQFLRSLKVYRGFQEMMVSSSRKNTPAAKAEASKNPDNEVIPIQDIYQGSYENMD